MLVNISNVWIKNLNYTQNKKMGFLYFFLQKFYSTIVQISFLVWNVTAEGWNKKWVFESRKFLENLKKFLFPFCLRWRGIFILLALIDVPYTWPPFQANKCGNEKQKKGKRKSPNWHFWNATVSQSKVWLILKEVKES